MKLIQEENLIKYVIVLKLKEINYLYFLKLVKFFGRFIGLY